MAERNVLAGGKLPSTKEFGMLLSGTVVPDVEANELGLAKECYVGPS